MMNFTNIHTPTLLLDERKARRNLERMAQKAEKSRVRFRPHFKTHQSAEIGEWFREAGVTAITVSSLKMAEYFARHGWDDITVAFPVNVREIDLINKLAAKIQLGLLVESDEALAVLDKCLKHPVDLWIKVDTGYGRTGVPWNDLNAATPILEALRNHPKIHLRGLLTHAGHSYKARGENEVRAVYQESLGRLRHARDRLRDAGAPELALSIGDTPSCSVIDSLEGVDEIRPGNFIFYDWTQYRIGSCNADDIAVALACPVVAVHPERRTIIVYGGAVHFSKDFLMENFLLENQRVVYGAVASLNNSQWGAPLHNGVVTSLSQENTG